MNYEELMNTYNSANPFANTVGVRVTTVRDGYAEAEVPIAPLHGNTIRSLHGGVAFTLADTVTGCAARSRGQYCTTIEGKLNYIRAASLSDKKLLGIAKVIHFGRKTIVLSVEIRNDAGKLIATGLFTYFVLEKIGL